MHVGPEEFIDGGRDACFQFDEFLGANVHNEAAKTFLCAAFWLIQEGYISAHKPNRHAGGFQEVVLTHKGLQVLDSVPKSLEYTAPLGERLVASAKTGAKDALKLAAKEALSIAIKSIHYP